MLVYQQGISNRSLIMTSYKQLVKTIYIPKVHQNYRISWNKCPPSNKHPISNNHPPQISAPSLSLIAGIQGKPVSIATLLITLCVNCIMGLRYRGTTGERNNSPPLNLAPSFCWAPILLAATEKHPGAYWWKYGINIFLPSYQAFIHPCLRCAKIAIFGVYSMPRFLPYQLETWPQVYNQMFRMTKRYLSSMVLCEQNT